MIRKQYVLTDETGQIDASEDEVSITIEDETLVIAAGDAIVEQLDEIIRLLKRARKDVLVY